MQQGFLIGMIWTGAVALLPAPLAAQGLFEEAISGKSSDDTARQDGDFDSQGTASAYELNGHVRAYAFVGRVPDRDVSDLKEGLGELGLKLRARVPPVADAFGEVRFRSGLTQASVSEGPEATTLVREALVNLYLGPLDLRVGHQIIAWGRADAFNPTDNVTPKDFSVRSADLDDRRLGNLAVRSHLHWAPFRFEVVWVPFFESSTLPPFELKGPVDITVGPSPTTDRSLQKGLVAGRLHLETTAVEASFSYLVGHANMPGIALGAVDLSSPLSPSVALTLSSHQHQVFGFDFAAAIGEFVGLRGEVAYRRAFDFHERDDIPRPDLRFIVGVDREIMTDVTLIAQYMGTYVWEWQAVEPASPLPFDDGMSGNVLATLTTILKDEIRDKNQIVFGQQTEVSHAASLTVQMTALHETLKVDLLAYYNATQEDYLVRPKMTYLPADAVEASLGAEIYGGPDDTLAGLARDVLTAGFAELRLTF